MALIVEPTYRVQCDTCPEMYAGVHYDPVEALECARHSGFASTADGSIACLDCRMKELS